MFKVKDKVIIWGDSQFPLPEEVADKTVTKVYGTATAGLLSGAGILVKTRGHSVEYMTCSGYHAAGHLVGDVPAAGEIVYTREQLEPRAPHKSFTLVSEKKIQNQLNWINVEFTDGTLFILCPFTLQYEVQVNA